MSAETTAENTAEILVGVQNLHGTFTGGKTPGQAVNGVSLQVRRGEVVALIGESGLGKSVTLRTLLRLLRELQRDLGLPVIFVTHDIGAAAKVRQPAGD